MNTKEPQQPDPRGRLDVLAQGLLKRVVEQSNNPVATAMYEQYGEEVNAQIEKLLAPRDRRGRIKRR